MILPATFLLGSVSLDLLATYCIKRSHGFKHLLWGVSAIMLIIIAFILLSLVLKFMPLGVAYSAWGSLGVLGTVVIDRFVFNSRLGTQGYVGVGLIVIGIVALQLA